MASLLSGVAAGEVTGFDIVSKSTGYQVEEKRSPALPRQMVVVEGFQAQGRQQYSGSRNARLRRGMSWALDVHFSSLAFRCVHHPHQRSLTFLPAFALSHLGRYILPLSCPGDDLLFCNNLAYTRSNIYRVPTPRIPAP